MHNCDSCEIITIVAILSWNIALFVAGWLFKCNWIDLWSVGLMRFFWMWTANHIAGLNGLIHKFQARTKFRSGPICNSTCCSDLALIKRQSENNQVSNLLSFASCLLIDPKGFNTLFRQSTVQRIGHYLLARIQRLSSLIEKFTDIILAWC